MKEKTSGQRFALHLISLYQRWISPHKGFCCAYRHHAGRKSCSAFGFWAIDKHGVWCGIRLILRRFEKCNRAYRSNARARSLFLGPGKLQAGFCDLETVGCCCGWGSIEAIGCMSPIDRISNWWKERKRDE